MADGKFYGYTANEWASVSEVKKQVARNKALDNTRAQYGDFYEWPANLKAAKEQFNNANYVGFDAVFGPTYNFNTFSERYFPNTRAATVNADETAAAQVQLNDQAAREAQTSQEAVASIFNKFANQHNTAFSGCDITPSITIGSKTFVIGNITGLSYSIHRDVSPVRVLGRAYPKSYVSAARTIAGSLVFNVFDTHVLAAIRETVKTEVEADGTQSSPLTDQLPPFDVSILYANEHGHAAYMRIYGLQITDEGQTHNINDIYTENVMQYVARDIDLMTAAGAFWSPQNLASTNGGFLSTPGTSLVAAQQDRLGKVNLEIGRQNDNIIKAEANIASIQKTDSPTKDQSITELRNIIAASKSLVARLESEKVNIENALDSVTEAAIQDPRNRLGSKDSRTHDSPYGLIRSQL